MVFRASGKSDRLSEDDVKEDSSTFSSSRFGLIFVVVISCWMVGFGMGWRGWELGEAAAICSSWSMTYLACTTTILMFRWSSSLTTPLPPPLPLHVNLTRWWQHASISWTTAEQIDTERWKRLLFGYKFTNVCRLVYVSQTTHFLQSDKVFFPNFTLGYICI